MAVGSAVFIASSSAVTRADTADSAPVDSSSRVMGLQGERRWFDVSRLPHSAGRRKGERSKQRKIGHGRERDLHVRFFALGRIDAVPMHRHHERVVLDDARVLDPVERRLDHVVDVAALRPPLPAVVLPLVARLGAGKHSDDGCRHSMVDRGTAAPLPPGGLFAQRLPCAGPLRREHPHRDPALGAGVLDGGAAGPALRHGRAGDRDGEQLGRDEGHPPTTGHTVNVCGPGITCTSTMMSGWKPSAFSSSMAMSVAAPSTLDDVVTTSSMTWCRLTTSNTKARATYSMVIVPESGFRLTGHTATGNGST